MHNDERIDGALYAQMLRGGTEVLGQHAKEVDDLNVFPIPDGDTGENMLLTIKGGASDEKVSDLSHAAKNVADGMLMSARGNSGVILSQFFEGISHGFENVKEADEKCLEKAFRTGVEYAYNAVVNPTEGTILTVIREATEFASRRDPKTPKEFLAAFLDEAKKSLERTPELLPVLKKAGVVDSGGAGIVYIAEGMKRALSGEEFDITEAQEKKSAVDYSAFDEDSVLEYGYCTELLLRLQNAKTDIAAFSGDAFTDQLKALGDSVVTVVRGSIVKVHVHTKTPSEVLSFCQRYGEFLNVKIENMSLQHNSRLTDEIAETGYTRTSNDERRRIATVSVASGEGIISAFREMGADEVIDGGRALNPSVEDFIKAFDTVNADAVIVFPNNGNSVMTAKQAAEMYTSSKILVVESKSIGEGYAALSMLDTELGEPEDIADACREAMADVQVAQISRCIKDTEMDGYKLSVGDYLAIRGKSVLAARDTVTDTFSDALDSFGLDEREIMIMIRGRDLSDEDAEKMLSLVNQRYPRAEVYDINGGQDIYDCIIIVQ